MDLSMEAILPQVGINVRNGAANASCQLQTGYGFGSEELSMSEDDSGMRDRSQRYGKRMRSGAQRDGSSEDTTGEEDRSCRRRGAPKNDAREKNRQAQRRFRARQKELITSLHGQTQGMEKEVWQLKKQVELLRKDNELLKAERERLNEKVRGVQADRMELRDRIRLLNEDREELKSRLKEAQSAQGSMGALQGMGLMQMQGNNMALVQLPNGVVSTLPLNGSTISGGALNGTMGSSLSKLTSSSALHHSSMATNNGLGGMYGVLGVSGDKGFPVLQAPANIRTSSPLPDIPSLSSVSLQETSRSTEVAGAVETTLAVTLGGQQGMAAQAMHAVATGGPPSPSHAATTTITSATHVPAVKHLNSCSPQLHCAAPSQLPPLHMQPLGDSNLCRQLPLSDMAHLVSHVTSSQLGHMQAHMQQMGTASFAPVTSVPIHLPQLTAQPILHHSFLQPAGLQGHMPTHSSQVLQALLLQSLQGQQGAQQHPLCSVGGMNVWGLGWGQGDSAGL